MPPKGATADTVTLVTFGLYMAVVVLIAVVAMSFQKKEGFVKEYFLAGRTLGPWALALTFAATSASGGSFMGFPSIVFDHGWVVALWIGGYMIVPIVTMGVLGKRMNQVARKYGAITIPDLLRDRFDSPGVGVISSIILVIFIAGFLLAQFKAGAIIMQTLFGFSYTQGLMIFAVSVVVYTSFGGFRAVVWTDMMQGIVMGVGILILLPLALRAAGGLAQVTQTLHATDPQLVYAPGQEDGKPFLPIGAALSFFCVWTLAGMGQPGNMLRLMAFRDSKTLARAILLVTILFGVIYFPIVIIFVCARAMDLQVLESDQVMPALVVKVAPPLLAGVLIAAPYAAIMSTVDSFLLQCSSSVVRDIYQRSINPHVKAGTMRILSPLVVFIVGAVVTVIDLKPPARLQDVIVFAGSGLAVAFLVPIVLALFWRRATGAGAIAAMTVGTGFFLLQSIFDQIPQPFGLKPFVWGLVVSLVMGIVVSLLTRPPDTQSIRELFAAPEERREEAAEPAN